MVRREVEAEERFIKDAEVQKVCVAFAVMALGGKVVEGVNWHGSHSSEVLCRGYADTVWSV